jgi:creatinine amidohydrolase
MSKARMMFDMTVQEIQEGMKETQTVLVPVGIVEQHGYHLPVSVDIHNAEQITKMASELSGCFVTPALTYCFSGGTLPGTINLSPQVFSLALMDIIRSLITQGFKNIAIVLGHGGSENTKACYDAVDMYQRLNTGLEDITLSIVPFWKLSPTYMKSFDEGDFHAGRYETSMMLYWKPELVKLDKGQYDSPELVARMRTDPDAYQNSYKALDSEYMIPKITVVPELTIGVMGNFDGAYAEFGKQIAEECATNLAAYVRQLDAL